MKLDLDIVWPGVGIFIGALCMTIVALVFTRPDPQLVEVFPVAMEIEVEPLVEVTEEDWLKYIKKTYPSTTVYTAHWTHNWEKAIGQALHFAKATVDDPIVLLLAGDGYLEADIEQCQWVMESMPKYHLLVFDCSNQVWLLGEYDVQN